MVTIEMPTMVVHKGTPVAFENITEGIYATT